MRNLLKLLRPVFLFIRPVNTLLVFRASVKAGPRPALADAASRRTGASLRRNSAGLSRAGLMVAVLYAGASVGLAHSAEVDIGFFYDRLALHGHWHSHPHHGWVWAPHGVHRGWRPYTVGRWVYVEPYGWLWDSYEDWGWATYHYGRWIYDVRLGWLWVPGYLWGPAWVEWRLGAGYIGWAPLAPEAVWAIGVGLRFGPGYSIPHTHWVFVHEHVLLEPHLHRHVVSPERNITIINNSQRTVQIVQIGDRVVNRSIDPERIERVVGRKIERRRVEEVDSPWRLQRRPTADVTVYRPAVRRDPVEERKGPPTPQQTERLQEIRQRVLRERQQEEQRQPREKPVPQRREPPQPPIERQPVGPRQPERQEPGVPERRTPSFRREALPPPRQEPRPAPIRREPAIPGPQQRVIPPPPRQEPRPAPTRREPAMPGHHPPPQKFEPRRQAPIQQEPFELPRQGWSEPVVPERRPPRWQPEGIGQPAPAVPQRPDERERRR